MTKEEFLQAVAAKDGFVRVLADLKAPDSVSDILEKRYLVVETQHQDGTHGQYNVFYNYDTENDVATYYNVEKISFEKEYLTPNQVILQALDDYCESTFEAHFLINGRLDLVKKRAEIVVLEDDGQGGLIEKKVLVYKIGTNPITHKYVIDS